jgi:hypothetical protein
MPVSRVVPPISAQTHTGLRMSTDRTVDAADESTEDSDKARYERRAKRHKHRRWLVGVLGSVHHLQVVRGPAAAVPQESERRVDVHAAHRTDGRQVWVSVPDVLMSLHPRHAARRMAACCDPTCARLVTLAGVPTWQISGCDVSGCPVCATVHSVRTAEKWTPAFSSLLEAGARLSLVTFTRRAVMEYPGLGPLPVAVSSGEVEHLHRRARRRGFAVPGETLTEALTEVQQCWATWCKSSRTLGVLGALRAIEVTQVSTSRDALGRPLLRWHVHIHAVIVSSPGGASHRELHQDDSPHQGDDRTFRAGLWAASWCMFSGADVQHQHIRRITDVSGARQVAKYLVKPGATTEAGAIESWLALHGTKARQPSGCLYRAKRYPRCAAPGSFDFDGRRFHSMVREALEVAPPEEPPPAYGAWYVTDCPLDSEWRIATERATRQRRRMMWVDGASAGAPRLSGGRLDAIWDSGRATMYPDGLGGLPDSDWLAKARG